jgi:hypothetical protein
MRVNSHLIEKYLWILTMGRAASAEEPMADLSAFDPEIDEMAELARADGNEDLLRISIDALIARPEGRLRPFAGQVYRFPDREFVQLLTYAYERIWPDMLLSLPGEEMAVEFEPMTDQEWAAYTGRA